MKYPIVIPLTIFLLASCQPDKQVHSQVELYIRYEEDTQKILAEASFSRLNEHANPSPILPTGGVAFLSSNMEKRELPGGKIRYSHERKLDLPTTLNLAWNNEEGNRISLQIDATKIVSFDFSPSDEKYTLTYDAPPISENESLVLLFTDVNHKMLNRQFDGPLKSNSISLEKEDLKELSNGAAQLSLVRSKNYVDQLEGYKCLINYSFYSKTIDISL